MAEVKNFEEIRTLVVGLKSILLLKIDYTYLYENRMFTNKMRHSIFWERKE